MPDRDAVDGDAVPIRQLDHQIVERQAALLRHPRFEPVAHRLQLAMPAAIALPPSDANALPRHAPPPAPEAL
jgi:hypothetical protein